MTDKELEQLLQTKEPEQETRTNISLVLSPHIVRNAAILKKRRQDRIQTLLCALSAVVFLALFALLFFLLRNAEDPSQILKSVGMAAGGGAVLFLICAPALVWHEENS